MPSTFVFFILLRTVFALLLLGTPRIAAAQEIESTQQLPALGDDPRIAEAGIELSMFATGLEFPMGMVPLPDNSLLVATSSAAAGGSFFESSGALVRLTDADGDGVADDEGTVLADGLLGPIVALARAGDLIIATGARYGSEVIYVFQRGDHWRSPFTLVESSFFDFAGGEHQSYALATRPTPDGEQESWDVFFNVGAYSNLEVGDTPVTISGLITGEMQPASVYMTTVTFLDEEQRTDPAFTTPVQIASGLRNASGLVIDPEAGDLIIAENGIDTPENRIVSFSADEIDVIPAAEIGGEVEDFGFPENYVDYHTGKVVGDGEQPVIAFTPLGESENEGVAGIAPVPAGFPDSFRGGYIAGFHGQFDQVGGSNEENPLLFADLDSGESFQLIANDNDGVGHLDSMTATKDTLFVADLCATGSLEAAEPCGVIYRITAAL